MHEDVFHRLRGWRCRRRTSPIRYQWLGLDHDRDKQVGRTSARRLGQRAIVQSESSLPQQRPCLRRSRWRTIDVFRIQRELYIGGGGSLGECIRLFLLFGGRPST